MKRLFQYLFPEKTKWVDCGCYDRMGVYYLLQMRVVIRNNKKQFRISRMGMVNDYKAKPEIYKSVLSTYFN